MEYLMRVCVEDTSACASDARRSKTRPNAFKRLGIGVNVSGERTKVNAIVVGVVVREGEEHAIARAATSAIS